MAASIPEGFELGFCPVPVADAEGNNYVCKYQSYFGVPTDAKNPEGGMNFIKFIYAEAGQVAYAHAGMISYLKDLSESAKACYSPVLQDAIATANGEGVAFVENLGEVLYRSLYDVIDDNLTLIVLRQITVDQFCDAVQAQYDSLRNDSSVVKIAVH
jgi:ABC-type glycerol-3-phosphate transport system substrate-binding protein